MSATFPRLPTTRAADLPRPQRLPPSAAALPRPVRISDTTLMNARRYAKRYAPFQGHAAQQAQEGQPLSSNALTVRAGSDGTPRIFAGVQGADNQHYNLADADSSGSSDRTLNSTDSVTVRGSSGGEKDNTYEDTYDSSDQSRASEDDNTHGDAARTNDAAAHGGGQDRWEERPAAVAQKQLHGYLPAPTSDSGASSDHEEGIHSSLDED